MKTNRLKILFITTHSIEPYKLDPVSFSKYEFHPQRYCKVVMKYGHHPILSYLSLSVKRRLLLIHKYGFPTIAYPVTFNGGYFNYEVSRELLEDIIKCDADIIHVHNYYSFMYDLIVLAKKLHKKPIVAHYHGGDLSLLLRPFRILKMITLPLVDKLIVANKEEMLRLTNNCRVPKEKIACIHDGVDIEFFRPLNKINKRDDLILFVGNLVKGKGLELLLLAFKKCKQKIKKLKLFIAGEGYLKRELRKKIRILDLVNDVKLLGRLTHEQLRIIYNKATVTVLPSERESFGMVLIESMACGTPVIATISDGPKEIISHGVDGLLVPQGNVDALSEAICNIVLDNSLRKKMGINARKKVVNNFSLISLGKQLDALYKSLLW